MTKYNNKLKGSKINNFKTYKDKIINLNKKIKKYNVNKNISDKSQFDLIENDDSLIKDDLLEDSEDSKDENIYLKYDYIKNLNFDISPYLNEDISLELNENKELTEKTDSDSDSDSDLDENNTISEEKFKSNLKKNNLKYLDLYYYTRFDYFYNLNIPEDILPFDADTRYYIFTIRTLYLTLNELSKEQIHNIRNHIEDRKYFDFAMDIIDKSNKEYSYNYDDMSQSIDNIISEDYDNNNEIYTSNDYDYDTNVDNNNEIYTSDDYDYDTNVDNDNINVNEIFDDNYYNNVTFLNLSSDELNNPIFLNLFLKLCNTLMYNGKRFIVIKALTKAFSILKNYGINKPLEDLVFLLYTNLVPIVKSREISRGNKKKIGILLNIYQRISLTIKIFVKGIRTHKMPLHYAIAKEYINLLFSKSYLNIHNQNVLKEIDDFKLLKYLNLSDDTNLTPESIDEIEDNDFVFSTDNLMNINWLNFDAIIRDLKFIILLEKVFFEAKIFKLLKDYIILKYYVDFTYFVYELDIDASLIYKYNLEEKHKAFTYPYFASDFLENIRNDSNYIDLTKQKALFDLETNDILEVEDLTEEEKKEVLKLKLNYNILLQYSKIEEDIEGEEILFLDEDLPKSDKKITYKKSRFNFVFWEFLYNPEYLHVNISKKDIKNYVINNRNNFSYLSCFILELMTRSENAKNLTEEDFLLLFMGKNPNLIYLDLKAEDFEDIISISKFFETRNIWEDSEDIKDFDINEDDNMGGNFVKEINKNISFGLENNYNNNDYYKK
jgi:ribosomal protein S7